MPKNRFPVTVSGKRIRKFCQNTVTGNVFAQVDFRILRYLLSKLGLHMKLLRNYEIGTWKILSRTEKTQGICKYDLNGDPKGTFSDSAFWV